MKTHTMMIEADLPEPKNHERLDAHLKQMYGRFVRGAVPDEQLAALARQMSEFLLPNAAAAALENLEARAAGKPLPISEPALARMLRQALAAARGDWAGVYAETRQEMQSANFGFPPSKAQP